MLNASRFALVSVRPHRFALSRSRFAPTIIFMSFKTTVHSLRNNKFHCDRRRAQPIVGEFIEQTTTGDPRLEFETPQFLFEIKIQRDSRGISE